MVGKKKQGNLLFFVIILWQIPKLSDYLGICQGNLKLLISSNKYRKMIFIGGNRHIF